ncbi:MAG TPA: type IV secretion system protein VirB10 [Steroidobacteraceae bacterium]
MKERATDDSPQITPGVRGERGATSVNRIRSLQSRVSSVMACGLMILLGLGMLTWYYSNALSRQGRPRRNAQASAATRAEADAPLPAIGRIEPIATVIAAEPRAVSDPSAHSAQALAPTQPPPPPPPVLPLAAPPAYAAGMQYSVPPVKSPAQLALERKLSGVAFAHEAAAHVASAGSPESDAAGGIGLAGANGVAGPTVPPGSAAAAPRASDLTTWLQPSVMGSATAQILPTQRLLLAKGTFIDCTLETAIDSTLPGMTTCITATDTFGVDGDVILLERGTKLIGETRGQVQQGTARVFVLWTQARTPTGVVVPLDSPGTDELGRSGLAGEVDRHFWDRFGAAILISTLDGAVQAAVQSTSHGSGAVIYDPSTSAGVMTDVLKSTVNIAPTVTKRNGDRIQVFVARDLDFRPVYELRRANGAR